MKQNQDYAKQLLTFVQNKGMQLKISLGKNKSDNTLSVTIDILKDGSVTHSESQSGTHFTAITQALSRTVLENLSQKIGKEPEPAPKRKAKAVVDVLDAKTKVVDGFYVANVEPIIIENQCPNCHERLFREDYDIPVFVTESNFKQYYKKTLLVCPTCENKFMTLKDWNELVYSAFTKHKHAEIERVLNMRKRRPNENDTRLYIPILETSIYFEGSDDETTDEHGHNFASMNKQSTLHKMGYNVHLKQNERQQILQEHVNQQGLHNTIKLVSFFMRTQNHHPKAQKIWQSDLNFLYSIDPRHRENWRYTI